MQKKRQNWQVLAAIIGIILVLCIFAYNEYQGIKAVKELKITLVEARIEKIELARTTLVFTLNAYNPNKVDVRVGTLQATIYANGAAITSVELPEPVMIPSGESYQQYFLIQLNHLDLGMALIKAIKEKTISWTIRGNYLLQLPFGIDYPYTFELSSKDTTPE